jgi:hypothetical protein
MRNAYSWANDPGIHYCKQCETDFRISFEIGETGDFFLECPRCNWTHYRRIENGQAIHCDIKKRKTDPITVRGKL